jgi:SAM-dependent methyltransferase
MTHKERVPKELFKQDGHYLGRPADMTDRIIQRRLNLTKKFPGFIGKDLSLLEIGCGNGASMFGLSQDFDKLIGVEINSDHQKEFELYRKENNIANCEFRVFDIENNPPFEQFDRVISFEVIEHLTSEDSVKFYADTLKENGLLAISVPNKWWIFETHGAKLPILPWNRVPFFSWLPRFLHEKWANARIYTKKRIRTLLEKHGFEILQISYVMAPMDVLPKGRFKNFVIKYFFNSDITKIPFKSTAIFVVGRKK